MAKYPVQSFAMLALLLVAFAATESLLVSGSLLGRGSSADEQTICSMTNEGLRACRSSVSLPRPADACCTALSHANLTCLCSYKSYLPMMGIDPNQAMQLPSKCDIPPPEKC